MPPTMVHEKQAPEQLAPGLWLDRLQPGGRRGPADQVLTETPGGQVWTDMFLLGTQDDAFQMMVPDIRMPANQYWPLHWHDCWIAVVILDGSCLIGDWWMEKGDVLISEKGLEYGPLVIGPDGCQLFEVFARAHEQQGGYAPEYRDHPTLHGGQHVFKVREGINLRNEGKMCLPCDGVEGLIKGRLRDGQRWDLGDADDPERGIMGHTVLKAGEGIAAHSYAEWHALFVLAGSIQLDGRELPTRTVIIAEPDVPLGAITAGPDGAELFEVARTVKGMERQALVYGKV